MGSFFGKFRYHTNPLFAAVALAAIFNLGIAASAQGPKKSADTAKPSPAPAQPAKGVVLKIISAGSLAAPLKTGFVAHHLLREGGNAIVVHAEISNTSGAKFVLDKDASLRFTTTAAGAAPPKTTAIPGIFIQLFVERSNATVVTGTGWFSWFNLGDIENPDIGTHVYVPLDTARVTVLPKGKFDFWVILPFNGKETGFSVSAGALHSVVLPSASVEREKTWSAALKKDVGQPGGARNFIPREAPAGVPTEDGLPAMTIGGITWRAGKNGKGPGMVCFRQVGSNSWPFGGAGEFETDVKLDM